MKIVHLMGYFVPELGYQEYYLAKQHKRMGHDVCVIASDLLYPFPNIEAMLKEAGGKQTSRNRKIGLTLVDGLKLYRLPHIFEYNDFVLCSGLRKLLEKIKPDVVFAHESRQGLTAMGGYYKNKFGYKLVVDQHDFYHEILNHPLWKKVLRFMDYNFFRKFVVDYSLRKADQIVAVTNETKEFLIKIHKINPKNISVIPLGVDTSFFRFDSKARLSIRKKLEIKESDVALVFSGTIVRRKGIELLLESLSEIEDKNVKLIIVGSGEYNYMQELKELVKNLYIEDKCIFIGFVKKDYVKNYFSAADIGVWPGNNSISIMEAMACRLPIVMVDLQLSHLIDYGNGLKFPQHNKEKLKKALKKLIGDKNLRTKMANKSLNTIKKHYSYDEIAKDFLDLARN